MSELTLKCLACKKQIENYDNYPTSELLQPVSAVAFTGYGHYGSRYDLSFRLAIIVCDDCLSDAIQEQAVISSHEEKPVQPKITYRQVKSNEEAFDSKRRW